MKRLAGLISCHRIILRYTCEVARNTFWFKHDNVKPITLLKAFYRLVAW